MQFGLITEQFSNELVEVLVLNKDEKSTAGR